MRCFATPLQRAVAKRYTAAAQTAGATWGLPRSHRAVSIPESSVPPGQTRRRSTTRRRHMNALDGRAGLCLLAWAALAVSAAPALAQQNIDKLKQMKVASTDLNIPTIPQTGKNADQLRENLKKVKLPAGFKIDLYAVVPD